MRRALLWGALALVIGCGGEDSHPPAVSPTTGSGGHRATGGKSNKAGSAGRAGGAGTAGRGGGTSTAGKTSTGGKTISTAGSAGIAENTGSAGEAGTAGTPTTAGNAGYAGAGYSLAAPVVKIAYPTAIADPNANGVLKASTGSDSINVTCTVTPANAESPVDPASVAIALEQNGTVIERIPTGGVPTFYATFTPVEFVTGKITLRCGASLKGNPSVAATDSIQTFVDKGPLVAINLPEDKSAHASTKVLDIAATVEARPVDPADTRAAVDTVEIRVDGRMVRLPLPPDASGVVTATPKLNDPLLFGNLLPVGDVSVQVIAKNLRGTTVTETVSIFVDLLPPTVTVISPTGNQIVKETGIATFKIADADTNIDLSQLRVRIGSDPDPAKSPVHYYSETSTRWFCAPSTPGTKRSYQCTFRYNRDDVKNYVSQATLFVDVADVAGNDTATPTTPATGNIYLNIDRVPPFVHLDPPTVRAVWSDATSVTCSNPFDPVGFRAVNDASVINLAPLFRALVWDSAQIVTATNPDSPTYDGANLILSAQTDPTSVYVYVQRNTTVPLLVHRFVDNDGDGKDDNKYCNAINTNPPSPAPTPDAIQLAPVVLWGSPSAMGESADFAPSISGVGCTLGISTTYTQAAQCAAPSDLPFVMSHSVGKSYPVIFAKTPTNSVTNGCTGTTYQFPADTAYGWMCAAGVANDLAGVADGTAGNMGVSPPMRLCYAKDSSNPIECPPATMPTCTDGCTVYDPFLDTPALPFVYKMSRFIGLATQ